MANTGRVTREIRSLQRTCLVPRDRGGRAAALPGPDLRLVGLAAALMVLLAAGTIAAVSAGVSAAAFLPLAGLALLVRPALVLHHRRARRAVRAPRPLVTAAPRG